MYLPLQVVITLSFLLPSVVAFSFSQNSPSSCDSFAVTWSGGSAPFYLLLTPVFGTPRNISIPSSAYSGGNGSYSIDQLPFPASQKFLVSMSDATGFGTGGTTEVLTTGTSTGGSSCNTTEPGIDFDFQLNSALQQCRTYTFSGYSGAVQPITITGLIPGGDSFVLNPPKGSKSYDWTADVYNGTDMLFILTDSQQRSGGSSDLYVVAASDDSSCINSTSPSSTMQPSTTATSSSSATSTPGSPFPIGAVAASVLGGLLFIAVFVTLGLFYLRRKRRNTGTRPWGGEGGVFRDRRSQRLDSEVDLVAPSPFGGLHAPTGAYTDASPGVSPFTSEHDLGDDSGITPGHSSMQSTVDPFTATQSSSTMSSAQRKAAMAGNTAYKPSRFVLHTDIDDVDPPANEDGVVELPPQYSERREPISAIAESFSTRPYSLASTAPPPHLNQSGH